MWKRDKTTEEKRERERKIAETSLLIYRKGKHHTAVTIATSMIFPFEYFLWQFSNNNKTTK